MNQFHDGNTVHDACSQKTGARNGSKRRFGFIARPDTLSSRAQRRTPGIGHQCQSSLPDSREQMTGSRLKEKNTCD